MPFDASSQLSCPVCRAVLGARAYVDLLPTGPRLACDATDIRHDHDGYALLLDRGDPYELRLRLDWLRQRHGQVQTLDRWLTLPPYNRACEHR